jgi:L-amino acid N-acyltransferase YncA
MGEERIIVRSATRADIIFADKIIHEMESSAIARGSGMSKRSAASIKEKMETGNAIIAITEEGQWVGFAYLEPWDDGRFVSNNCLIISSKYRNRGIASAIETQIFELSRNKYPEAMVFNITSGLTTMKMDTYFGFVHVTYAEIAQETGFWEGCKSCVNYDALQNKNKCHCLFTAMCFNPLKN